MKFLVDANVCAIIFISVSCVLALPNRLNTPEHTCIACLCHARSGCYSLQNCANYSISYDYWIEAGAPTIRTDRDINQDSYKECIRDDNCILNTIINYVAIFEERDCVCDGTFDCRDMLSMHLYGENCIPVMSEPHESRYNNCARQRGLPLLDSKVECVDVDL